MQRTTTIILTALAACALAAQPALAGSRFVIRGAGFGHGVGMSQYGAEGYALHGKDHRFILAHYYTGTSLDPLGASPTIRVLLQTGARASFTGASRASGRKLSANATYFAVPVGLGRVALRTAAGKTLQTVDPPLRVTGPGPIVLHGGAQNGLSDGRYRGAMEFRANALGALESINAVGLEDYVRGVVGAESPSSWAAEALKAQAVAARTYAVTTAAGGDYDQYADTRSQMYLGVSAEVPSTEAAVASTRGQVVTYAGQPVTTFFFSTSGGRTENVENSFLGSPPRPWLKSVPDPYDNVSPVHRWGPITMTLAAAGARLRAYVRGSFRGIDVIRRGRSPRIVSADVVGSRGRTRVSGPTLRDVFGLRDTWATFNVITSTGKTRNPPRAGGGGSGSTGAGSTGGAGAGSTGGGAGSGGGSGSSGGGGSSGGAAPGGGARAAWLAQRGVVSGRVGWVHAPTRVDLQRREGPRWSTVARLRTTRSGHYAFLALPSGSYRVAWRGDTGSVVAL